MPGRDDDLEQTMESIRLEMPAVVLLDVYMHKFNGFDLLCAIRQDETTKRIGVIVSSEPISTSVAKKKELIALS